EFVYPKAQAIAIATANHTSVASEDNGKVARVEGGAAAETPAVASTTATETKTKTEEVAENRAQAPAPAPAPEPAPAAVGTSGQSSAATPAPAPAPAPARARRLPRTASQLSLFELLSGLSIAVALGVRQW